MSNLHVNLDEANKHTPKGFDNAASNTRPWKDESSQSTYTDNEILPRALNFVDGTTAPPTTTNGHIYVITGTGTVNAGWGSASFNDWVRFANGFPVSISPVTGYLCYDITASQWMEFDGTTWAAFGGGGVVNTIYTADGTLSGNRLISMPSGNHLALYSGGSSSDYIQFRSPNSSSARSGGFGHTSTGELYWEGVNRSIQLKADSSVFPVAQPQLTVNNSQPKVTVKTTLAVDTNAGVRDSSFNSLGPSMVSLISGNNFGVGINGATAKLHVKSSGSTSATTALLVQNSLGTDLLEVKDDGSAALDGNLGLFGNTPIAQPTTAVAASILGTGAGTGLTDLDTFDGYTLQQVVKALRNLGILA